MIGIDLIDAALAPAMLVALLSLTVTLGLAPLAFWVWITPTVQQVLLLGIVAFFATAGHYCMARAFAAAPASMTQPVVFLQLVWATLLGWFAFGEKVDPYVILGGAIIIAAISYMSWREAQIARVGATPAPDADTDAADMEAQRCRSLGWLLDAVAAQQRDERAAITRLLLRDGIASTLKSSASAAPGR